MKIGSAVRPGRVPEKKGQQDGTLKKSQSGNISLVVSYTWAWAALKVVRVC